MIGIVASYLNGCPWAGGKHRSFERTEVVAFGKTSRYNDFITRYLVRLADGTELFVKANEQTDEDMKWLRKLAKGFSAGLPDRDAGWTLAWKEVAP